jgi:hypothetical protein
MTIEELHQFVDIRLTLQECAALDVLIGACNERGYLEEDKEGKVLYESILEKIKFKVDQYFEKKAGH